MTKTKNFNEQDLLRASETLKAHDNWSVMAHRKADGDAIGSVSALITAGLNAGKRVKWFGADPELPVSDHRSLSLQP